ncbi:MAG: methyl-coenzyme M reductase operon protein D [Candidatus Methanomethylophilaceae archaeon]|jgi:methyl-coenzyme M reductase subunit D
MQETPNPAANYAGEPLPEIKIFPNRLLKAETTEKLLSGIYSIPQVRQINVHGESLPATVKSGPNTGLPVNHPERKTIRYGDQEVLLTMLVGAVFIELKGYEAVDETMDEVKKVCDEMLPFGYTLDVGRYSKFRPSLNDYLKSRC